MTNEEGPCSEAAEVLGISPTMIGALQLLQEKWVLFIMHALLHGPAGFNCLARQAQGVNSATLAQRLASLEEAGLLTKTVQSTMPPRTSYDLTEAGRALAPVFAAIEAWSEQHFQSAACKGGHSDCLSSLE